MATKKNKNTTAVEKISTKKKEDRLLDDETSTSEESVIDPAIIEDTFTEEFSEYNDVDNL